MRRHLDVRDRPRPGRLPQERFWRSASRQMYGGAHRPRFVRMSSTARAGLVVLVLALFGIGQWQVWSGPADDRLLHAALVTAYSLPLLVARVVPMPVAVVVS